MLLLHTQFRYCPIERFEESGLTLIFARTLRCLTENRCATVGLPGGAASYTTLSLPFLRDSSRSFADQFGASWSFVFFVDQ